MRKGGLVLPSGVSQHTVDVLVERAFVRKLKHQFADASSGVAHNPLEAHNVSMMSCWVGQCLRLCLQAARGYGPG